MSAEGEPVEEDRQALADPVREPEQQRRHEHGGVRRPAAEAPAEGLGEVAAEAVLLARRLQRGEQDAITRRYQAVVEVNELA